MNWSRISRYEANARCSSALACPASGLCTSAKSTARFRVRGSACAEGARNSNEEASRANHALDKHCQAGFMSPPFCGIKNRILKRRRSAAWVESLSIHALERLSRGLELFSEV